MRVIFIVVVIRICCNYIHVTDKSDIFYGNYKYDLIRSFYCSFIKTPIQGTFKSPDMLRIIPEISIIRFLIVMPHPCPKHNVHTDHALVYIRLARWPYLVRVLSPSDE
jgi:hypothetical protein